MLNEIVVIVRESDLSDEEKNKIFHLIRILRVQFSIKANASIKNVHASGSGSLDT